MIKKLFISTLLIISLYLSGTSQVKNMDALKSSDTVFFEIDPNLHVEDQIMPEFPGGEDSLIAFVKNHITYPPSLIKDSIEGNVIIRFYIDEKGFVENAGFLKTLHPELEKLCIELVKKLPGFIPGSILKRSNKGFYWGSSKFLYMLPIYFCPTKDFPVYRRIVITPD